MPVHLAAPLPADIHGVPGVRIGVAEAGIRKVGRKDLTVFLLDEGTAVAGVFTRNRFCAAPVQVCREHLASAASVKGVPAPARMAWPVPVPPVRRRPGCWACSLRRCCLSPPG